MSNIDIFDWFIQSKIYTHDDSQHHLVPKSAVLGVYAIILDKNKHCILSYEEDWKPFYFHKDYHYPDENELLKSYLFEDYDISVQDIQLIGSREFRKKNEVKYAHIYLVQASSPIEFDQQQIAMFKFSQLVDLPVYNDFKAIFDYIYNPLKLDVILDIDRTLLMSYVLGDVQEPNNSFIMKNHYILKNRCNPDYIINTYYFTKCIWLRPHMYYFLDNVSKLSNLSFWTATEKSYQQPIVEATRLDSYSKRIFYADTCSASNQYLFKSITDLNKRPDINYFFDPKRTILVDDSEINLLHNPTNCLKVDYFDPINVIDNTDLSSLLNDCTLVKALTIIKALTDQFIHQNITIPEASIPNISRAIKE